MTVGLKRRDGGAISPCKRGYCGEIYKKRYDGLTERFGKAKARLEEVTAVISDKSNRQATIEDFLKELQAMDGMVTEFDPMLWVSLVDFVTVYSKDDVQVTFKDGTEIRA